MTLFEGAQAGAVASDGTVVLAGGRNAKWIALKLSAGLETLWEWQVKYEVMFVLC